MSDKHVYKTLRELADNKTTLCLSNGLNTVDRDFYDMLLDWFCHNVDIDALASELYPADELTRILNNAHWMTKRGIVYDKLNKILMYDVSPEVLNKYGKYSVRLKKILKQQYKIKSLTENDYCKISTLFGDWKERTKLRFEFARKFDWEDGDFGDEGSCFWGDRAAGRDTLEYYNALAIKFYKIDSDGDLNGVGRAWIARINERDKVDGAMVMFNRYGVPRCMDDIKLALKCVDKDFVFKHVSLENKGTTHGKLYINGDAVAISYEEFSPGFVDLNYTIQYGVYNERSCEYTCSWCGDGCDEDDMVWVGDDGLCGNCADEHTIYCECCNETHYRQHSVELAGNEGYVCNDCRDRYNYMECSGCGCYERPSDTTDTTNGDIFCSYCADGIETCDQCNFAIDTNNDTVHNVESEDARLNAVLCDSCFDEYTFECKKCEIAFYDPNKEHSNNDVCEGCKEEIEYESK